MNQILHDLSEPALVQAIEANLFELIKARSLWLRADLRDEPEWLSCFTDILFPHFNVVLRALLPQGYVDSAIQFAIERCKSRQVPLAWVIGPATSPPTIADSLVAHGFMHMADNPGMAMDLQKMKAQLQAPPN